MNTKVRHSKGLVSLSPLLLFLVFYLLTSIVAEDFYAVPVSVAFLVASIYSLFIIKGETIDTRFSIFAKGITTPGVMMMICIFILAGGFAASAKQTGAVESMVNLTLTLLPSNMILCSLFLSACIISFCMGTSVGTIAALSPIALGIAEQTGFNEPQIIGIVVGGAFFGDNLSFISDTTIVATKSQGCEMRDKFRKNIRIAIPAAILCLILYYIIGQQGESKSGTGETNIILLIPYIYIIATSLMGMNVLAILASGIFITAAIGIYMGSFDLMGCLKAINDGIMGMSELIIVTLLAACMMEVIRYTGGIEYLMDRLARRINGRRGAEMCIASLAFLTDLCTANNTIAILSVGSLSKEISTRYELDSRRCASILDTSSCVAQSLIPYGAQLLIAGSLTAINPIDIIPYLYYPLILGFFTILNIMFNYEKVSSNTPDSHID